MKEKEKEDSGTGTQHLGAFALVERRTDDLIHTHNHTHTPATLVALRTYR